MSRRDIPRQQKQVRVRENPITHEMEFTILDQVQRDYELIVAFIEGRMAGHNLGGCARLGAKVAEWLRAWEKQRERMEGQS